MLLIRRPVEINMKNIGSVQVVPRSNAGCSDSCDAVTNAVINSIIDDSLEIKDLANKLTLYSSLPPACGKVLLFRSVVFDTA